MSASERPSSAASSVSAGTTGKVNYQSITIRPHLCRAQTISQIGQQKWWLSVLFNHSIDYERYRVPLVLLACLQAFMAAGIFYGWSSLYVLFLEKGVYSELCFTDQTPATYQTLKDGVATTVSNNGSIDPICVAQKSALQLIYTVASSVNLMTQLPWGYLLDRLGPRLTSCSSLTLVIAGFLLLGQCSATNDYYLPAISLISAGGPGVQISLFHLSELFPTNKSMVLSIVAGAFQLGFTVFLGFKNIYLHNYLSFHQLCYYYCVPLVALLLLSMILWPDSPCIPATVNDVMTFTNLPSPLIGPTKHRHQHEASPSSKERAKPQLPPAPRLSPPASAAHLSNSDGLEVSMAAYDSDSEVDMRLAEQETEQTHLLSNLRHSHSKPNLTGEVQHRSFLGQLFSSSFTAVLLWMSCCLFWANFYIGTVVEQIYLKSQYNSDLTRDYSDYFNLCLPVGILGIPVFGLLTDRYGFSASIGVTSAIGVVFAVFNLLPGWVTHAHQSYMQLQFVTFVSYSFFRTFVFSTMFAYLAHEFGYRHFGLLSGIVLGVGAILGFAQYPLQNHEIVGTVNDSSADDQYFLLIGIAQFATMVATILFAVYCYRQQCYRQRIIQQQIADTEEAIYITRSSRSSSPFLDKPHNNRSANNRSPLPFPSIDSSKHRSQSGADMSNLASPQLSPTSAAAVNHLSRSYQQQ